MVKWKQNKKYVFRKNALKLIAGGCMAALFLTACGGVTEEQLAARVSAIEMMEQGRYEDAVDVFNSLVQEARSVTDFELDVLKYRAEAEYQLGDCDAALHTYKTLIEVDKKRPEYCYLASLMLSKTGSLQDARTFLESGKELDQDHKVPGYLEASMAYADGCAAAGETELSQAVYQQLIREGFGTTKIYNRLVMNAIKAEDYKLALDLAAKGLALPDTEAVQQLKFNEAVCYEYLGEFSKALELFRAYANSYGSDERVAHEIAFLETR